MNRDGFVEAFYNVARRAVLLSEKSRREGLLAIEDDIDLKKANDRDVFEFGLRLATDGVDPEMVKRLLSNLVKQEKDEYVRLLKTIQQEAVLSIYSGLITGLMVLLLDSYTDIPLGDLKANGIDYDGSDRR